MFSVNILIWALPVLLAITVHEAAHGYVARAFGDPTAEQAGRITLNPLRHIDPVGTIAVPLSLYLLSSMMGGNGILFGWAKPVPVNFNRLRHPKADMLWVAAAGPLSNLAMAVGWACLHSLLGARAPDDYAYGASLMAMVGISINGVLMLLNLLPVPPLDGGRIAVSLLPDRLAWKYARIEPFGFLILLALLLTGLLGVVLGPLLDGFTALLMMFFGN
ncbi:MAG: site-2 protease family protein [Azoarcus sp.]|jgi:Zn-dependent protease|nr:site-2 protease family protein [Azoarcus sp.]